MSQEKWTEEDKDLEDVKDETEIQKPEEDKDLQDLEDVQNETELQKPEEDKDLQDETEMQKPGEEEGSEKIWVPFACMILFVVIIFVMTRSVSAPAGEQSNTATPENLVDTSNTHADMDFKDMEYVHYDPAQLYENVSKVKELSKEDGKQEEIFQVYDTVLKQYDEMNTMSTLNDIYYYTDPNQDYYVTEQQYNYEMAEEVTNAMGIMVRTVLESSYGNAFREKIGQKVSKKYENYKELTDDQRQILKEERNLVQEYEKNIDKDVTVEIDGKKWSKKELSKLGDSDEDIEKLVEVTEAMEKKRNYDIVSVYKNLIQTRTRLAKSYGYEQYMDYAYEKVFERDFTKEDAKKLQKYVEEYIAPLYEYYLYYWGEGITEKVYEMEAWDSEKIVSTVQKYVNEISPELGEAYEYMVRHKLYDIEASDTKMDMGFTTKLASYQAPFIFDNPYGNYYDIKTMIHEFGHYNNFYQFMGPSFYGESCLEIAEMHSQGLELLFIPYYKDMFGADKEDMEHCLILDLLGAIIDGCVYNEFERTVYENPNMSNQEMNKKFYQISKKYGRESGTDEEGTSEWIETSHIFQTPFYYVSYATSGLSSFNIWQQSLEDRENAIKTYMNVSKVGSESSFLETLENNNLKDIFKENFFVDLYEAIDNHYVEIDDTQEIDLDEIE